MARDEEALARALREVRPAPAAWVRAAKELPALRRQLDDLVLLAERDQEFQAALNANLEAALRARGVEPTPRLVNELRVRLDAQP